MNDPILSPAQVARIDRALRRINDLIPVIERCERCRIPMDEAKVLIEEQRATLQAMRDEFGPPVPLNDAMRARRDQ